MADEILVQYKADVSGLRAELKEAQTELKNTESIANTAATNTQKGFEKTTASVKSNTSAYVDASAKRKAQLDKEVKGLEYLRDAQKKAFDPVAIKNYNALIKDQEEKIKLLGGSLSTAAASTEKLASTAGGGAPKIAKFYGGLRTLANIIPGIGISGLILQGYEFLIGLFGRLTGSVEVNTEAIKINKEAVDKLNDSSERLAQNIESTTERQLVAQGKLTDFQSKRLAVQDKFNESEIEAEKEKNKTLIKLSEELGIKLTKKEKELRDQNGKVLIQGDNELIADLKNNDGSKLDQIKQFNKEKDKLDKAFNNERKKASEAFESELAAIDSEAIAEKNEKDAQKLKKQKSLNDKLIAERERLRQVLISLDIKNDEANLKTQATTEEQRIEFARTTAIQEVLVAEKAAIDSGVKRVEAESITHNILENIRKNFDQQQADRVKTENDKAMEEAAEFAEKMGEQDAKIVRENLKKRLDEEKKAAEARRKLEIDSFQAASSIIDYLSQINTNLSQQKINEANEVADSQLAALQKQYDGELISKEEFEAKKDKINADARAKEAQLKKEAFEFQKQASLIQAIIATAQGVATALTGDPYTVVARVAIAAAIGAAQIAVIESQPVPKFEKGGKVKGRRHTAGGTLIEAEADEFIVKRNAAIPNNDLLQAINSGKTDKFIFENYIAPALQAQQKKNSENKQQSFADNLAKSIMINSGGFKDSNLLDSLQKSRRNDREIAIFLAKELKGNGYNPRNW